MSLVRGPAAQVLRIINEPTAASLAYGLDKTHEATILVFDLGGGTFDVSILEVGDGVFEVRSTAGDTHLGGDDFDKAIVQWLADDFRQREGIDLLKDRQVCHRGPSMGGHLHGARAPGRAWLGFRRSTTGLCKRSAAAGGPVAARSLGA